MRKCLPRSRLPLPSVASPVSFPLPDSDYRSVISSPLCRIWASVCAFAHCLFLELHQNYTNFVMSFLRRVGVGGGCASDSQEENDDSGSDDDDDDASDSDAVPDSAGTTKPGARGAAAASSLLGAHGGGGGGGKRGGSKSSGRKLNTAATQRQSFSEYVAQRRKSSGKRDKSTLHLSTINKERWMKNKQNFKSFASCSMSSPPQQDYFLKSLWRRMTMRSSASPESI